MIKGRDFVFTSLQHWDLTMGSNVKDIALEISKNNRVLYVNTPLDKKSFAKNENTPESLQRRNVVNNNTPSLRQLNKNLWILDLPFTIWPVNFLPDGCLFDFVNYINNRRIYIYVKKLLNRLSFKNYILFIDNDIYRSFYAKELLNPDYSIYYRRDNLVSSYWKNHVPRLEPQLFTKSNLVISNSAQLAETANSYNENTYDVGQGLDLTCYDSTKSYSIPDDLSIIPYPIIGYIGLITSLRLDAELLYDIAQARPTYSLVLVGAEDEYFKNHRLHTLSNVYFLGEKPFSLVSNYIFHFDVCINPQKINDITIGNYPRKIDEYLALGKPVVATRTKSMEMFDPYVWNCIGNQEYLNSIDQALESQPTSIIDKRIEFAQSHTWENSVNKIYTLIK